MAVDWLEIYYDDGIISPDCYAAWNKAKIAYKLAVETGANFDDYRKARRLALEHHAETGDCKSDLIQISYDTMRCCDVSQLKRMAAEGDVRAKLELFIKDES